MIRVRAALLACLALVLPLRSCAALFGHHLRQQFFFQDNFTQTNHGAYGGTPRPVIAYQYSKVAEMEARIDPWFNNPSGGYQECIHEARALLAGVINSNVNDTVLVDNASEAVNDILRNMEPPLGPDQWILDLSTAYAPFQGFYSWLTARLGVQVLQVPIAWPVTGAASFVDPVRAALANATQQGLRIRIAVISHISAYPAVVLPVRALVDVLHAAGIPVIIDGAHCLGNIAIDIEALGDPEFYFANAHKWYFSAKSAAVLYVRRDQQQKYVPAPSVVDNPETQTFADRFYWTGTRDRTAFCSIMGAKAFRDSLGGEAAIMAYTQSLAAWAYEHLSRVWQVPPMAPLDMMSSMALVKLPADDAATCATIRAHLTQRNWSVSGWSALPNFACYLRLSAQVYLEQVDFVNLGQEGARKKKKL